MSKKISLRELINKIDWIALNSRNTSKKLPDDCVSVTYCKSNKKNNTEVDMIRIRMGCTVVKELGFNHGDKIYAAYDPDDIFSIILVKREGEGRTLAKETNTNSYAINYRWIHDNIKLNKINSVVSKYEIYKGYIHILLPRPSE